MIVLDCESLKTTTDSLAKIYQIEPRKITDFLKNYVLDSEHRKERGWPAWPEMLRFDLEKELEREPQKVDRICWFHFTGNLLETDYHANGLLRTNGVLDDIWKRLFNIFSKNNESLEGLKDLRLNKRDDSSYWRKINQQSGDGGPHAMLVRNVSPGCNFFGIPEIVNDIRIDLEMIYSESIFKAVESHCTPTIVKFWSVENEQRVYRCISVAVFYAHEALRDLEFTDVGGNHTCFDGKNKIVPPDRIISVKPA